MFGEKLYEIIQAQNISCKELSRATGISQSTISKFLSGNQEPKYNQIIQLAKAVNLPPDIFICVISSEYDTVPPVINDCCLMREIYKDVSSKLRITTLYSFKEFRVDMTDGIYDEAIYISVILNGGTKSKLGSHYAGEFRIVKGTEYKGVCITVLKDTIAIVCTLNDTKHDLTNCESRFNFEG